MVAAAETTGDSKSIASGQNNVEYYKIELKNFMEKLSFHDIYSLYLRISESGLLL